MVADDNTLTCAAAARSDKAGREEEEEGRGIKTALNQLSHGLPEMMCVNRRLLLQSSFAAR